MHNQKHYKCFRSDAIFIQIPFEIADTMFLDTPWISTLNESGGELCGAEWSPSVWDAKTVERSCVNDVRRRNGEGLERGSFAIFIIGWSSVVVFNIDSLCRVENPGL